MKFLFSILFLLLSLPVMAATYYIDNSAGLDSANGTSTATAWRHCPGDPAATGNPASASLQSGDTIIFKGGIYNLTGTSGIALKWGGVTYDGNSAGTWGTGKAVLTDNFSANAIAAFSANAINNLVFNNFAFTNIGGSNAFPAGSYSPNGFPAKPGYGIRASHAANILIENCYFGELGYYQQFPANIGGSSLAGSGFYCPSVNGVTISNCEFTQIRHPIQFGGNGANAFNVNILNCFFHDQMEWGISVICVNSFRSNIVVSGCVFSNTDQYYVGTGAGGLWAGYGGGGPHQNCIMMFNGEGSGGASALDRVPGDTNVFIFNNKFLTTMGYPGGTTTIWVQDSTTADIYNNIFYLTAANNAIAIGEPAANTIFHVGVYNNTFYCHPIALVVSGSAGGPPWAPVWSSGKFINIKNNVFSTLNNGNNNAFDYELNVPVLTPTNNVTFDYNEYFSDQTYQGHIVWGLSSVAGYIFSPNSFTYGWDAHSVAGLPLFVNATHSSPYNYDFHLTANSPAMGMGLNLTGLGLPGLTNDLDGNPRPATGPWTAGAYAGGANPAGTPSRVLASPH
jgi:hypothetical protein